MAYDIPVFGTMAHSFIMSFETEIDAFRAFSKTFPDRSTLLIDTYDDLAGAKKAIVIAKELEKSGYRLPLKTTLTLTPSTNYPKSQTPTGFFRRL
jgi:nicotinic acid phosphoribosyltransferase